MKVRWFMNNCRRHRANIALMAAGLCPKPEERRAGDHLQECARCRAYFQELKAITGGISRLKKSAAKAAPSGELTGRWMDQIKDSKKGQGRVATGEGLPVRLPWLTWGLPLAACVLLFFYLGQRHNRQGQMAVADPLENVKMIRATLAMFPNQLKAIVEDEHGMKLVLSDSDNVPRSSPLYIHVCEGNHCSSYLTFSGQEITVAGQKVTVLEDAHGEVILTGKEFVWSDNGTMAAGNHLEIKTKNLGSAVM